MLSVTLPKAFCIKHSESMRYISRLLWLAALLATMGVANAHTVSGRSEVPWPSFDGSPYPHPRLLMHAGEEPTIRPESMFAKADSVIVAFSNDVLDEPVVTRKMIGRRLLHTSREALKRIFWLGYTYRVHGGERYARKAIDEMLAVCAFSDWNPSHFLAVTP